jgi:hypothetical protein
MEKINETIKIEVFIAYYTGNSYVTNQFDWNKQKSSVSVLIASSPLFRYKDARRHNRFLALQRGSETDYLLTRHHIPEEMSPHPHRYTLTSFDIQDYIFYSLPFFFLILTANMHMKTYHMTLNLVGYPVKMLNDIGPWVKELQCLFSLQFK